LEDFDVVVFGFVLDAAAAAVCSCGKGVAT
jgi:hypothetical protein